MISAFQNCPRIENRTTFGKTLNKYGPAYFAEILNNNTVKKYIMDDHAAADI